jgi:putative ABC transport system permease protein
MGKNNIFLKVTLRQMKKAKVRTAVTLAGIIMSTALITAIATFVSSLQNSMVEYKISESGNWYGVIFNVTDNERLDALYSDERTDKAYVLRKLGSVPISTDREENSSDLNIMALEHDFAENIPMNITSGRMAENDGELVVSRSIVNSEDSDGSFKLGDSVTFTINGVEKSYTIVGIGSLPGAVAYNYQYQVSYGFTLYENDNTEYESTNVYFTTKKVKDIYSVLEKYGDGYETDENTQLLKLFGASKKFADYYVTLYTLAAIVTVLVMAGSVLMIYNSFAISLSERTKQFGLLSSVGATKQQLRISVFYEAMLLGIAGIPTGIIVGIVGIWITLICIKGNLRRIASSLVSLGDMNLHVSWLAVIVAFVTAAVTIFISVMIPMLRISRMTPLQAIRQNNDIKLTKRKVKTSKIFNRLFGFEGMYGRKSYKRSKSKYRTTVMSLFVSVVLFISAAALGNYLVMTIEQYYKIGLYDISFTTGAEDERENILTRDELEELKKTDGVSFAGISLRISFNSELDFDTCSDEYIKLRFKEYRENTNDATDYTIEQMRDILSENETDYYQSRTIKLYGIEDAEYKKYLEENNLSVVEYMSVDNPKYLLYGMYRDTDRQTGKVSEVNVYSSDTSIYRGYVTDYEKYNELYDKIAQTAEVSSEEYYEAIKKINKECREYFDFNVGNVVNILPMETDQSNSYNDVLLCSESMLNAFLEKNEDAELNPLYTIYFKAPDHETVYNKLKQILSEKNVDYVHSLTDITMEYESEKSLIFVVHVFAYGFLVMLSLIAVANVFNTISTNMILRRREFAMLKSVGLTERSFRRILYYECIMYGTKSLLLGIPVSILITAWIYNSIAGLWAMRFFVPWTAVIIAVLSVYFIVFITMIYSKNRLRKLNLIDCIKEENI